MTPDPSPTSDLQTHQAWKGPTMHVLSKIRSLQCPLCANTGAEVFP